MVTAGVGDINRFERLRRKLILDLVINWMPVLGAWWVGEEEREREKERLRPVS